MLKDIWNKLVLLSIKIVPGSKKEVLRRLKNTFIWFFLNRIENWRSQIERADGVIGRQSQGCEVLQFQHGRTFSQSRESLKKQGDS